MSLGTTQLVVLPAVFDDFDRFLEHLEKFEVESRVGRIADIVEALDILTRSPFIGRPVSGGKRELVIGRGAHGYIALYRYIATIDTVFILAMRSQRQAVYRPR